MARRRRGKIRIKRRRIASRVVRRVRRRVARKVVRRRRRNPFANLAAFGLTANPRRRRRRRRVARRNPSSNPVTTSLGELAAMGLISNPRRRRRRRVRKSNPRRRRRIRVRSYMSPRRRRRARGARRHGVRSYLRRRPRRRRRNPSALAGLMANPRRRRRRRVSRRRRYSAPARRRRRRNPTIFSRGVHVRGYYRPRRRKYYRVRRHRVGGGPRGPGFTRTLMSLGATPRMPNPFGLGGFGFGALANPWQDDLQRVGVGAAGFFAARVLGKGLAKVDMITKLTGEWTPIVGNLAAVAGVWFLSQPGKPLARYRSELLIGTGLSLVDSLLKKFSVMQDWLGDSGMGEYSGDGIGAYVTEPTSGFGAYVTEPTSGLGLPAYQPMGQEFQQAAAGLSDAEEEALIEGMSLSEADRLIDDAESAAGVGQIREAAAGW